MQESEYLIFLDFDGPIVEHDRRSYALYKHSLKQHGLEARLSLAEYWECKRSRVPEKDLLRQCGLNDETALDHLIAQRLRIIEQRKYLSYDRLVRGTRQALEKLRGKGRLVLVSNRRSRRQLFWELGHLGIRNFFSEVLSTPFKEPGWQTKTRLISAFVRRRPIRGVIVGDTEVEIQAAKHLGLMSIAVLSGIRGRKELAALGPDFIVPTLADAVALIGTPYAGRALRKARR